MASTISPLSHLNPSAYATAVPSASAGASTSPATGVSATAEIQAIQKQGNFQSLLNDSIAVALLQPASASESGTAMTTLVNNMLQQVLGAYQKPAS